jgi:hypothetical protein
MGDIAEVPDLSGELMGLLEGIVQRGMIAMFHATYDDVGNCNTDGMRSVVGYVATKAQWDYFNGRWQRVLDDLKLDFLHTAKYLNSFPLVGGSGITDDDVYRILEPFIQVVRDVILQDRESFAVAVLTQCAAYEQLTDREKKVIRPPDLNSFELAVGLSCFELKNKLSLSNPIAVQLDESDDAPRFLERYVALKRENDSLREYLGAICFADDKKLRSIQAADMLANVWLKGWRSYHEGKDMPRALRELIFMDGKSGRSISHRICGLEMLRGLAEMRMDLKDRMAMPDDELLSEEER